MPEDRTVQIEEFFDWLHKPSTAAMFDRVEHYRALARGQVTAAMIERGTQVLAELANYGSGCQAAAEMGKSPCAKVCQCKTEAEAVIRAAVEGAA